MQAIQVISPGSPASDGGRLAVPRLRLARHLAVAGLMLTIPVAGAAWSVRVDESVTARGHVDFLDLASVTARVSARIEEVLCREAQFVRRGEVLFVLDDERFRSALKQWEGERDVLTAKENQLRSLLEGLERDRHPGELARERAQLEVLRSLEATAASQAERKKELRALLSAEEVEGFRRNHEAARLRRKAKEEEIRSLEARQRGQRDEIRRSLDILGAERTTLEARGPLLDRDLEDTRIRSPIDGYVLTPNPERLRGLAVQPGQKIVEIADPAKIRFVLAVDERDIGKIRPGQTARLQLDAYPYYIYGSMEGTVAHVLRSPDSSERGRIEFRVLVDLTNRGTFALTPGLSGEGVLTVRPKIGLGAYLFRRLHREAPGTTTLE